MNDLSWLIYLAGVVGTLKAMGGFGFVVLLLFIGFCSLVYFYNMDSYGDEDKQNNAVLGIKEVLPYAIGLALILSFVPGQNTVYAIAASEMGESALNSKTGGKAVEALNAWLDDQISGDTETESEDK